MLTESFKLETVTYNAGCDIPEISGYGKEVEIEISNEDYCTVKINGELFLPGQIKHIIEQIEKYKQAVKAFQFVP